MPSGSEVSGPATKQIGPSETEARVGMAGVKTLERGDDQILPLSIFELAAGENTEHPVIGRRRRAWTEQIHINAVMDHGGNRYPFRFQPFPQPSRTYDDFLKISGTRSCLVRHRRQFENDKSVRGDGRTVGQRREVLPDRFQQRNIEGNATTLARADQITGRRQDWRQRPRPFVIEADQAVVDGRHETRFSPTRPHHVIREIERDEAPTVDTRRLPVEPENAVHRASTADSRRIFAEPENLARLRRTGDGATQ